MKMKSSQECFVGNQSRIRNVIIAKKMTNEDDIRVENIYQVS